MIIKVDKHGKTLNVQEHLNGKHREHCLCYQNCKHFKPNDTKNCNIAQNLYVFDIMNGVTTPVWECVKYQRGIIKEEECVEYTKNAHCEYSTKNGCPKNCSHYYKKK